ncbi:unnamed protein product [Soboliphyme baturini]|uniref:RT_RNaseH_2 domain-containing protein n=1 Tax=Soboliphyme baturini TaxID=241478 RepID=A0A183IKY0_9BILA|nr:unnamed protein product [Soboliphyme baturini]
MAGQPLVCSSEQQPGQVLDECPTCLRSSKKLPKNFCPRDIGYQVAHDEIFLKLIISEQVAFSAIPIEVEKSQDIYFLTSAAAILEV